MKIQIKGKLINTEVRNSAKTGQQYTLALVMQGCETVSCMIDRNSNINLSDKMNKDVIVTCDFNTKFKNIGSITDIKLVS